METLGTQVTIPATPNNLRMITALAADDPEFREAIEKDEQSGVKVGGGYVSPGATKASSLLSYRQHLNKLIVTPRGDTKPNSTHTAVMTDITREELNAKLEAIEARMDGRVASIEGKIDAFLAAQAVRDQANDRRFDGIEASVGGMRVEIRGEIKSMKNTTIVTAISAVLAIVFGIVTFNATLSSNMLAAFQAGKADAVEMRLVPSAPATAPAPAPQPGATEK